MQGNESQIFYDNVTRYLISFAKGAKIAGLLMGYPLTNTLTLNYFGDSDVRYCRDWR